MNTWSQGAVLLPTLAMYTEYEPSTIIKETFVTLREEKVIGQTNDSKAGTTETLCYKKILIRSIGSSCKLDSYNVSMLNKNKIHYWELPVA